ncbi:MAG TPA: PilZ domain-containing protein [Sphingomicrobium sp.]|nr:PilZ domain-containing protein [Sphingomicrobium sp.]
MNIRAKIFGGASASDEQPVIKSKRPRGAKADQLNSVGVKREESRRHNSRGDDRHRLTDEQARLLHNGCQHIIQLINVSGGGAMIAADIELALWDRVELFLGEGSGIECAVRWIRDDRIGLEFAHETRLDCSPDEQAQVLRDVITRSFPDLEFEISDDAQQANHDGPEQRGDRRHPLIWSGVLHHDYQSTPVRLRNISATGALIECSAPVRVGSEPLLELSDAIAIPATASWAVGDQVGLRFDSPFDLSMLARTEPEVAPTYWENPDAAEDSSSSAQQWGRMSLGQLRTDLEGFLKR